MNNRWFCTRACTGLVRGCGAAVVSGHFLLSGCYSYSAPLSVAPDMGSHVSIRLSSDAIRDLSLQIGPGVAYVEGVVLGDDSAGLHLAVSNVEGKGRSLSSTWTGERFTFPHDSYLSLEVRHLNVPGTMLVSGLGVVAMVAMSHAFGTDGAANAPPAVIGNSPQ